MRTETGIESDNHALLIGQVLGALGLASIDAEPIMADDDSTAFTNEIRVRRPSGTYVVAVYVENARPE